MSAQVQFGSAASDMPMFDHGFEIINLEETKQEGKMEKKQELNDLIGCRLEFQWTSGRWYRGTICAYNSTKRLHHVLYDDGDEKWYYLPEMVFRFVNEEDEWIKVNGKG